MDGPWIKSGTYTIGSSTPMAPVAEPDQSDPCSSTSWEGEHSASGGSLRRHMIFNTMQRFFSILRWNPPTSNIYPLDVVLLSGAIQNNHLFVFFVTNPQVTSSPFSLTVLCEIITSLILYPKHLLCSRSYAGDTVHDPQKYLATDDCFIMWVSFLWMHPPPKIWSLYFY